MRWLFACLLVSVLLCLQVASAQTPISSCKDINSPGYYYLTQNLIGLKSGANYCIKISASNVVLDGNGHSLTGSGTEYYDGVYVDSASNITVKNLMVSGYSTGISLWYVNNSTITNVTAINNKEGVYLYSSSYNTIANVTANNNKYYGIYLLSSSNNTIANVVVSSDEPKRGIILYTSLNSTIKDSVLQNSGLFVWKSYDNTVTNTTVNGKPLIYLENVQDYEVNESTNAGQVILVNCRNVTVRNLDLSNTTVGVELWGSERIRVENVVASNNGLDGIYVESSSYNTVANIIANNNFADGIRLSFSNNSTIYSTIVKNNGWDGIALHSSNYNKIANVVADGNKFGIYVEGAYNIITGAVVSNSSKVGLDFLFSNNNLVYNNYFNNTENIFVPKLQPNTWNITKTAGRNIVGGNFLGGNYWGSPNGNGFSDACRDSDNDGICDQPYAINDNNTDFLPLAKASLPAPTVSTPMTIPPVIPSPTHVPAQSPTHTLTLASTAIVATTVLVVAVAIVVLVFLRKGK